MNITTYRQQLRRRAIRMQIGGFRPPDSPVASWFGRVNVALPGESWPATDGEPMLPLCQVNVAELPFRPAGLEDVALFTVFIGPSELPIDTPNGVGWCLRAYPDLGALVAIEAAPPRPSPRAYPMRPEVLEDDFPSREDVPIDLPASIDDRYGELFANAEGFKLGGWPTLVQSEIEWAPADPEPRFVFQIDSSEKANWQWGYGGAGYFGRAEGSSEWFLSWQCY